MKKMFVLAVLVTLFVSGAVPSAYAAGIIFDNGLPNQAYGTRMSDVLVAENFSIGSAASITNMSVLTRMGPRLLRSIPP